MKGDFSRVTFDAANHFSRVLLQQGRVTLDADPNEQAAILLHYLTTLAKDLIGPCGGPLDACGFQLSLDGDLQISDGRYYVDGILCENESSCSYVDQPDYPLPENDPLHKQLAKPDSGKSFWLYLDVWERHISAIEDRRIREVALGQADTCSRSKVVWQVKALELPLPKPGTYDSDYARCAGPLDQLPAPSVALLAADLDPGQPIKDPCLIAPEVKYRGAENQLYRIEIHRGGNAGAEGATFKWSRDNGSVASAWQDTVGDDLIVANARGFHALQWVELSDDTHDLRGEPGILVKLVAVEGDRLTIDPQTAPSGGSLRPADASLHPKVRAWDQTARDMPLEQGAVPIAESDSTQPIWINLEDGLRVRFVKSGTPVEYRTGDYWLVPARAVSGQIEWPRTDDKADPLPPKGIQHHYAPVGWVSWDANGESTIESCLCTIEPLSDCLASTSTPDDSTNRGVRAPIRGGRSRRRVR